MSYQYMMQRKLERQIIDNEEGLTPDQVLSKLSQLALQVEEKGFINVHGTTREHYELTGKHRYGSSVQDRQQARSDI